MIRKRVMPVLLLDKGRLVKTVRFKNPSYVGDPMNAIRIFNEKGVDEIVVLDKSAWIDQGPNLALLRQLSGECFMPLAYGGGLRTIDHVRAVFQSGVEKVILSSALSEHSQLLKQVSSEFGQQSVSVCVDIKKNMWGTYKAYTQGATHQIKSPLAAWISSLEKAGAGELILQSIDRDGTLLGYDLALLDLLKSSVSIPIVMCGGAQNAMDMKRAFEQGASGVAASSMFVFYGHHKAVLIQFLSDADQQLIQGSV